MGSRAHTRTHAHARRAVWSCTSEMYTLMPGPPCSSLSSAGSRQYRPRCARFRSAQPPLTVYAILTWRVNALVRLRFFLIIIILDQDDG